jgi:3-oxoacyl-[acyl-carrier protein] reductase
MDGDLIETLALSGRIAVVTGAASGIGQETAHVFAQAGASVALADVDNDGLAKTAALVEAAGGEALIFPCDISKRSDVDLLAAKVGDIWVNCAGVMVKTSMFDATEADLDRGIGVNLKGVYWGCVAAARLMQSTGRGSIINISSGGGESAVPGMSVYCLTKAAVNMITRLAAKEFGALGIRVNTIAPGFIDTPLAGHSYTGADGSIDLLKRDELLIARAQNSPIGIVGVPRDIALAALYLASDASRFMTGQNIRPNGGVAML